MSTRKYLSKQKQMFGYRAKDRLPEGHICFLIHEIVDELELGPAARGASILGAPCFDPRLMVKVLFYGYNRGIRSSRKLAAECRENVGFIHLCRGQEPDFRTIALFRRENGPLLSRTFSSLVRRLVEAGIVSVSHIIVDGTKVHANASNGKIIHRKFFDEVKKAIDEWMSASAELDAEEELREKLSSAGISTSAASRGLDSLQSLVEKCTKTVEAGECSKAAKASTTDPDSRFMRDGIGSRINLAYNVQVAVDAETGIPVGCDVTQDAHDSASLGRMVDAVEGASEEAVEAVDADCGFFNSDEVHGLEERGKDVCVADGLTKTAMNRGKLEELIQEDEFIYNASRDVFECEYGNEHVFTRLADKGNGKVLRVYVSKRRCDGCPRHERCFGRSQLKRHMIRKHVDFVWLKRHRKRFLKPEYQERLEKRRLIELTFGHWKHNLGFRKFLLRGLSGARVETFLVATASVLGRLCNILKLDGRSWASLASTRRLVGQRAV
ncbi:MAG: IS1182 family transposase [Deltaproteobacteria bacterium]|nr:IS1182 family transposase [Deltaproteobacteria bacterium]